MAISKLPSAAFASGSVGTTQLADGAVTTEKLVADVNFRNIIINGDMSIAQRGTSVSVSASTVAYSLDRFLTRGNSNTAHTVVQSTDAPTGFNYSLNLTRNSGQTGGLIRLQQPVETNNMVYLRGQKVTLSFYAKKDTGATSSSLGISLYTGDGTERARAITAYDNEVNAISDTATLTTSWQRFTFTSSTLISDLSQLSIEISYSGVGTAPSNDGYFITGVQLEAGASASDFEFLPYDVNLLRCQRYYQTFRAGDTIYVSGNQTWRWIDQFFCTMRTSPSVTVTDVNSTTTINQITDTSVERQVTTGGSGSKVYRADLAMDSEL